MQALSPVCVPTRYVVRPAVPVSQKDPSPGVTSPTQPWTLAGSEMLKIMGVRSVPLIQPLVANAFCRVQKCIYAMPDRYKGRALIGYAIIDQLRLSYTIDQHENHVESQLENKLASVPKGWVAFGFHGSRQHDFLSLDRHTHFYLEVIDPASNLKTKIDQAKYCTFYTQGVGRLYIVACKEGDAEKLRRDMSFCVENYFKGRALRDPETDELRVKLIDITGVQTFRSPYTVFRALWQGMSTEMHEGTIVL
jgi:hypothetical protein